VSSEQQDGAAGRNVVEAAAAELRTLVEQPGGVWVPLSMREQLRIVLDEREADARAVAALLDAIARLDRSAEYNAITAVEARFADRIDALNAHDGREATT